MKIFDYNYLYSAYADDTTFFLKYKGYYFCKAYVLYLRFFFLVLSVLKPNLRKSEIEGILILNGFKWQSVVCVV